MWFYIAVAALVVIGILGGIFAGGIFTIVLLPLALIVLIGGAVYRSLGTRAVGRPPDLTPESPLPHTRAPVQPNVTTTPERLTDERQTSQ